jgi:3',5'-cyclic AMP phosphodiesterase CpdA
MRFAILGDLHYSDYLTFEQAAARDRIFTHFFQQVLDLHPDFVFAVGDTTHWGTLSEMKGLEAIVQATQLPLIAVTGNHDCCSVDKALLSPFFLGGRRSQSATDLYTSFDAGSTRFVLLDTARSKDDAAPGGYISPAQLDWLEQQITTFNAADHLHHLVLLGHYPLTNTTRRSHREVMSILNSDAVTRVFAMLQPSLEPHKWGYYFCGHNHTHSIYEAPDLPWLHVQTADPLDCRSFRLVTLDRTGLEIETIDFDLSSPHLQADFETARDNIPSGFAPQKFAASYGEADDRYVLRRAIVPV